jgi:hypothetical protein
MIKNFEVAKNCQKQLFQMLYAYMSFFFDKADEILKINYHFA